MNTKDTIYNHQKNEVLELIRDNDRMTINEIKNKTGISYDAVCSMVMSLEIDRKVKQTFIGMRTYYQAVGAQE